MRETLPEFAVIRILETEDGYRVGDFLVGGCSGECNPQLVHVGVRVAPRILLLVRLSVKSTLLCVFLGGCVVPGFPQFVQVDTSCVGRLANGGVLVGVGFARIRFVCHSVRVANCPGPLYGAPNNTVDPQNN